MSACDQRAYYQTTNGLFKLRASDGDLMWESRPVSMADPGLETYYNLPVDLVGGHVVYCGVDGGTLKARIARQSGGLVTDVLETDSPGYLVNRSLGGGYNTDGTHIYLTGTTGFNPTVQWTANKYDLLGNHVDGGERFFGTTSFEQPGGRHSLPAADEFVLHFTTPNQVLRKYTGYVASHVAESSPINTALWDTRRHTLLFDGSDYYVTRRSGGVYRMLKVSVGALADGTTSAVIPAAELPFAGAISDGVMATYSGGINTIAEWDTAALTQT